MYCIKSTKKKRPQFYFQKRIHKGKGLCKYLLCNQLMGYAELQFNRHILPVMQVDDV